MSKANDSTQKLTVKFNDIDVKAITSTDFVDVKVEEMKALKLKSAYLNYTHPNGRDRTLQVLLPWIDITSGGVAQENAQYYKDTLQIPLVDNELISKLQEMDQHFDTDSFKSQLFKTMNETNKKASGNKKVTYEYSKMVRSGYTSESNKEYPPSLIVKLDLKNPKLQLQLYHVDDKTMKGQKLIENVTSVNDIRKHITFKSTIRPIVKFTNFQCSNGGWKAVLKLVGCSIIPKASQSTEPVNGCDFVSDNEEDTKDTSVRKVVPNNVSSATGASASSATKTIKPAANTSKIAQVSDDDDDEEDEAAKIKASKTANKKKEQVKQQEDSDGSDVEIQPTNIKKATGKSGKFASASN